MKAYKIMDKDRSGQLDINDIRQTYNAKQHPDVKAGKKTEDEILCEFLDTFEDHFCDMQGNADSRDGVITEPEWCEYYNNVSMSIYDDAYFELMMNNTWNLKGDRVTKKGWGGRFELLITIKYDMSRTFRYILSELKLKINQLFN